MTLNFDASNAERQICEKAADIFGVSDPLGDYNFLEVGGDSLTASRLVAWICERYHADFEVVWEQLIEADTIQQFAQSVKVPQITSMARQAEVREAERNALSYAQKRIWFAEAFEPNTRAYHIVTIYRLNGQFDFAVFRNAVRAMLRDHAALCTVVTARDGEVVQSFGSVVPLIDEPLDLGSSSYESSEAWIDAVSRQGFVLEGGPLFDFAALRIDSLTHVVVFRFHHLIADGWSVRVFFEELVRRYNARDVAEKRDEFSRGSYSDFVESEEKDLSPAYLADSTRYWAGQLAGIPADFKIFPERPDSTNGFTTATRSLSLDNQVSAALRDIARQEKTTLYAIILALFSVIAMRFSGASDLVVGTPVANRRRADFDSVIGCYINILPVRIRDIVNKTFRNVVREVSEQLSGALKHQAFPFQKIVEALNPERRAGRNPIFQVMVNAQDRSLADLHLSDLEVVEIPNPNADAKVDLGLYLWTSDPTIRVRFEYRTDVYSTDQVSLLADAFETLAREVIAFPEIPVNALGLLSSSVKSNIETVGRLAEPVFFSEERLDTLFEKTCERYGHSIAVRTSSQTVSYEQLGAEVERLCSHFKQLGVVHGVVCGVYLGRSVDLVAVIFALWKIGSVYLPLDTDYPTSRIERMMDDAACQIVITDDTFWATCPSSKVRRINVSQLKEMSDIARPDEDAPTRLSSDLAYILFTSGSTGRPKGVMVEHRNAVNYFRYITEERGVGPGDVVLQIPPISFDPSIRDIVGAMVAGAELRFLNQAEAKDPAAICRELENGVSAILSITPSLLGAVVDSVDGTLSCPHLRIIGISGEVLQVDLITRLRKRLGGHFDIVNQYGPTESTMTCAAYVVPTGVASRPLPIGRPHKGYKAYILNEVGQLCPFGVAGDLYLGGLGVSRGYVGRPDLTADRFIPNPFGNGERLYRTGDRCMWNTDGTIVFLGRIDHQVKLRGFRIELGEIEAALLEYPGVRQSVVILREDNPGDRRLVGYVVSDDRAADDMAALREHLKARLPDYMVPSFLVPLDELPLTPNGKTDRKALPQPEGALMHAGERVAPVTPMQDVLLAIWQDVLQVEGIGVTDSFFDLGGHSLLAIQIISRVRSAFDVDLPIRALFEHPTIAALEGQIGSARRQETGHILPPLEAQPRPDRVPASFAQERLWILDQINAVGSAYNMVLPVRLSGPLDSSALTDAVHALVNRHESLRTRIETRDGVPVQVIDLRPSMVDLDIERLSQNSEDLVRRHILAEASRPFDLAAGPLVRFKIFALSDTTHVLALVMHHIVSDGWSTEVLFNELGQLYDAFAQHKKPELREPKLHYADYTIWQRSWLHGKLLEDQLSYWAGRLANGPPVLDLPTDYPRPAIQSYAGAVHRFALAPELLKHLQSLARQESATEFMVFVAAFGVILSRWSNAPEVVVGTPVAGRMDPKSENLVGLFVNTLALRIDLSGDPDFRSVLHRVRQMCLEAYMHQDVPFERIVQHLQPARDLSRHPVFQVMLAMHSMAEGERHCAGLDLQRMDVDLGNAKFDLSLHLLKRGSHLEGKIEYATDLFDEGTIVRLAEQLLVFLDEATAVPDRRLSELSRLPKREIALLDSWNETAAPPPAETALHHMFETQAVKHPDKIAVKTHGASLTYCDINVAANKLARALRNFGVDQEVRVGVIASRSLSFVIAQLAVLKARGIFVPLDLTVPFERTRYILDDAEVNIVVGDKDDLENFKGIINHLVPIEINPGSASDPENINLYGEPSDAAYVIYTSGSTGKPKGVIVEHQSAIALLSETKRRFAPKPADVWTIFHSFAFDFSVFELWGALATGGEAVIVSYKASRSPTEFLDLLIAERVTILSQTPSAFYRLLDFIEAGDERLKRTKLRTIVFGGEELEFSRLGKWYTYFGDYSPTLVNMYGITEITVHGTYHRIAADDIATPLLSKVGKPLSYLKFHILDRYLNRVPIGVPGQIYVAGAGLARGYINRPDLTADRFVPDPFGPPGSRMYKTGDLGRMLPDGTIVFLGRIDHQVKLRGFRIELGEIEAALLEYPGVRQSVVILREDNPGDRRLVGYVVSDDRAADDMAALREHLKARLPDYMVPSFLVPLDELPLTPNGKTDRKALPQPEGALMHAGERVAPVTPMQDVLLAIWQDVLQVEGIGVTDSFFDLGGHSLLAIQIISRVRSAFDVDLPIRALFEHPTIAALEGQIGSARRQETGHILPPLEAQPRPDRVPASFAQERLWILDQINAVGSAYNMVLPVRLSGPLDSSALTDAVHALVNRHESLRTRIETRDGVPVQVIDLRPSMVDLDIERLSQNSEDLVRRHILAEASRPFDLAAGPLVRFKIFALSDTTHVLALVMHHIVSDGWSTEVLFNELGQLYDAFAQHKKPELREPKLHYADYTIWQRSWLHGKLLEDQLSYWAGRLANGPPVLDLPTDYPRPAIQSYAGAVHRFALAPELLKHLQSLARQESATEFMVFVAAFGVILSRWSNAPEVVVGTPVAGRMDPKSENLVGLFVNTLALRIDLSGDPDFRSVLHRVRQMCLEAYMHQDVPFERIVQHLQPARDLSRHPVFQVMLAMHSMAEGERHCAGLDLQRMDVDLGNAKFDLSLHLLKRGSHLEGKIEYATDLFDEGTIVRLAEQLLVFLDEATAAPDRRLSELSRLPKREIALLDSWNETAAPPPAETALHHMFETQAVKHPDKVAVTYGASSYPYRDLDQRANRLAAYLRRAGIGTDAVVAIYLDRSLEMMVALLGVLKAGAAYLPLDPRDPEDRRAYMLQDAGASFVLTQRALYASMPADAPRVLVMDEDWPLTAPELGEDEQRGVVATDLAYVLYTSGSTGRPKGVGVTHASVCAAIDHFSDVLRLGEEDTVPAITRLSFDISVLELLMPICKGASIQLFPADAGVDAQALAQHLAAVDGPLVIQSTPPLWSQIVRTDHWPAIASRSRILCGGDALDAELARELLAAQRALNVYGPTEATIWSSEWPISVQGIARTPIGRPIRNTRIHILDRYLNRVPIGVPGQIYVAGAGLARGYINRPDLTADRFVPDPFGPPGSRMYKTGDLGRMLPDGTIVFLGRIDHQVKLRGFRIELGEIEAALLEYPGVRQSVVILREDNPGDRRLVGYVVSDDRAADDMAALREHLKARLPDYMVPSFLVPLDELPLTPNGKTDRKALPQPEGALMHAGERVAPVTPMQDVLLAIWQDVLQVEGIGVTDSFFDLGGHSLLAIQIISRVRSAFDVDLPIRALFEHPTIAALEGQIIVAPKIGLEPVGALPHTPAPLSFAQSRLWFLHKLLGRSEVYNIPVAIHLHESIDVEIMIAAFLDVLNRHDILRSIFVLEDEEAVQKILDPLETTPTVGHFVLKENSVEAIINRLKRYEFDISNEIPIKLDVIEVSTNHFILVVVCHHIASDGNSLSLIVKDLLDAYDARGRGESAFKAPLLTQYADFARTQRRVLGDPVAPSRVLETQLEFWRATLRGIPGHLELPADRPRPVVATNKGRVYSFQIPAESHRKLRKVCANRRASVFMGLQASLAVLLTSFGGGDDIVFGSPLNDRKSKDLDDVVGLFVNTIVLRTKTDGNPSFDELVDRVRTCNLAAYENSDLPFEYLVTTLNPERSLSHHPIFQVMIAYQGEVNLNPRGRATFAQAAFLSTDTAKFDLSFVFQEVDEGGKSTTSHLEGKIEYATDLFDEGTIVRLAEQLLVFLDEATAAPDRRLSELSRLPKREIALLDSWNETAAPPPAETALHHMFETQAVKHPDKVAVTYGASSYPYRDLDQRANRLAAYLRRAGIGTDAVVAIYLDRSLEMMVALLGVLKAGAAYLPLDPRDPEDRRAYMLQDAGASFVLTQRALYASMPADAPRVLVMDEDWPLTAPELGEDEQRGVVATDLAYVLYTSGSTGRPKGVGVTHASVCAAIDHFSDVLRLGEEDTVPAITRLSFDISVLELLMPICKGASIQLFPADAGVDAQALAQHLAAVDGPLVIQSTPPLWSQIVRTDHWPAIASRSRILCGGDALDAELARELLAAQRALNVYGPTEATIWSSEWPISVQGIARTPIGRPIRNTRIHILDRYLNRVPIGVPGQIYVAGAGLARGYINRPDLTADRFVPDPFGPPGSRMYKTGDLGRMLPDGTIVFLGRIDHQVKLRGFRIELGEIEAALLEYPGVRQSVVILREDNPGDRRLVGYVVSDDRAADDMAALREHLKARLPDYMVPSFLVPLDELPLTPNGKTDRKALPQPTPPRITITHEGPIGDIEVSLSSILSQLCHVEKVGRHDNFFDLGANSLMLVSLQDRIERSLSVNIKIIDLFRETTVAKLAAHISASRNLEVVSPARKLIPAEVCDDIAERVGVMEGDQVHGIGESGWFAAISAARVAQTDARIWIFDSLLNTENLRKYAILEGVNFSLEEGLPAVEVFKQDRINWIFFSSNQDLGASGIQEVMKGLGRIRLVLIEIRRTVTERSVLTSFETGGYLVTVVDV